MGSYTLKLHNVVVGHVITLSDTSQPYTTKMQVLIVLVPSILQDTITKVNTGLTIVGTSHDLDYVVESCRVVLELGNVYLYQITEALIGQQNFTTFVFDMVRYSMPVLL